MLGERLQGLALILASCASLGLVYLVQQHGWLQVQPPTPPGLRPGLVPVVTPVSCILPMAALGAVGLCWVGLNKLFSSDDWRPPRH